ncbi:MAG: hypothetical protein M3466_03275, partial [Gemmatimonadota bacterium]|nr:hypothetical protein [Gemmatimonadota bacterium]
WSVDRGGILTAVAPVAIVVAARSHVLGRAGVRGRGFNGFSVRISISVWLVSGGPGRAWASAATKRTSAFVHQVVVWQGIK